MFGHSCPEAEDGGSTGIEGLHDGHTEYVHIPVFFSSTGSSGLGNPSHNLQGASSRLIRHSKARYKHAEYLLAFASTSADHSPAGKWTSSLQHLPHSSNETMDVLTSPAVQDGDVGCLGKRKAKLRNCDIEKRYGSKSNRHFGGVNNYSVKPSS